MRYLFIFFFIINFKVTLAKSVKCEFEEVYQDGSIQSGDMLFSDGLLRYEYYDKQLFTIIFNNDYFVIRNDNKNSVSKLNNDLVLNELKSLINNYPNIKTFYSKDNVNIKIHESKDKKFFEKDFNKQS